MKQSEAGDAVFFFAGGGTACLENASFCKSALPGCMGLLQNPVFYGQGCVATPHNRRFVASGHSQGRVVVVGCEGVGSRGGCSVRKVAQVARAINERRQDGKLEL